MMDWQRLNPKYWIQIYPTDLDWDKFLNQALDAGNITEIGSFSAKANGIPVWIRNWPHAYGHVYGAGGDFLPKVATRKRLRKAIMTAVLESALANQEQPQ